MCHRRWLPGLDEIGIVARTRVAGPVTTTSAASGPAASGGVSRSRNVFVPSPAVNCSSVVAICQFPAPSRSHQENPGVQSCSNRPVTCGMSLLTTCRWLSAAAGAQPGQRELRPVDLRKNSGQRREHLTAICRYRPAALGQDAGPRRRDLLCGRDGDAMPGRAEPLAQRGKLTGDRAIGGDRARLGEHPDDLSGTGPWTGPRASPLAKMRSASTMSRRSPGGIATGSVVVAWRPRGRGPEGQPDEPGSIANQVQPPGAGRRHRRQPGDAPPGSRPDPTATALEPDHVASPLVIHCPQYWP